MFDLDFNKARPQRVAAPVPEPVPEPAARTFEVDPNSRLGAAVWYAEVMRWSVFPIGEDKRPATRHGQNDATRDPERLRGWFSAGWEGFERGIAFTTGAAAGVVVVDLDIDEAKGLNAWDALEELGVSTCPETPVSHSPRGGCHLFFRHPGPGLFVKSVAMVATDGKPLGIDVKGDRSSCSLPPAPGRRWDAHRNLLTVPLAALPSWVPREPVRREEPAAQVVARIGKVDAYGRASLKGACMAIADADQGAQQETLNRQAYGIGRLIGGGELDSQEARRMLLWAAERMREYADRWPMHERAKVIDRGLAEGEKNPRQRPNR